MPRLFPANVQAWNVWAHAAPHLHRDSAWMASEAGKVKLTPTSSWRIDASALRLAMDAEGVDDMADTLEKLNVLLAVYRKLVK